MSGSFDRGDRPPFRTPAGPYPDPGHVPAPNEPVATGYEGFYDDAPDPAAAGYGFRPADDRPTRTPTTPTAPTQPTLGAPPAFYQRAGAASASGTRPDARAARATAKATAAEARRVKRATTSSAAIVPAGSVTGRSLVVVIGIMCFLACLTAGTVYMIHRSAEAWLTDMSAEVTVQIEPREGTDTELTMTNVGTLLVRTPGVTGVKPLSLQDSSGLLEPWLGNADILKTLPVPRLIAVEIDPASPPDLESLKQRLESSQKGVTLDDHRHWQKQIRTVTRSLALGGLMILLLVAAATVAIIVSATRSAMASNSDIVEVLHFVGATDRFIAREFERHFLKLGVKAGLVGATAAALVFVAAPTVVDMVGGTGVTAAELQRLVGSGSLDWLGYLMLVVVVVVVAALCMVTSRLGVFNILNSRT
jgi:cell division transport system permease protein